MRLLKVGDRTFNLDLLAWFQEGTRDELKPGVRPVRNGDNEVVNPEVDYHPVPVVGLYFTASAAAVELGGDEARAFVEYVAAHHAPDVIPVE